MPSLRRPPRRSPGWPATYRSSSSASVPAGASPPEPLSGRLPLGLRAAARAENPGRPRRPAARGGVRCLAADGRPSMLRLRRHLQHPPARPRRRAARPQGGPPRSPRRGRHRNRQYRLHDAAQGRDGHAGGAHGRTPRLGAWRAETARARAIGPQAPSPRGGRGGIFGGAVPSLPSPLPSPRHFDRSAQRGVEKSSRFAARPPARKDFSAPPPLRAGSGRNDGRAETVLRIGTEPVPKLNRTAMEQVRA